MKHLAVISNEFIKIADDLSGTVHKEREKRITLQGLPPEVKDIEPILIRQGVLKEVKNGDKIVTYTRIRMKQEPHKEPVYSLGVKNFPLQQEAETEISKQIFDSYYPDNLEKAQEKFRYSLPNGWDIDMIPKDGKVVAEYEHGKDEEIEVPKHWKIQTSKVAAVKPSIFSRTIYRVPTDDELVEVDKSNLSTKDIVDGFYYTMVGRGFLDSKSKKMIIDAIRRLTLMKPSNLKYKNALSEANDLKLKGQK